MKRRIYGAVSASTLCLLVAGGITGCSFLPTAGPSTREIRDAAEADTALIQLVDINDEVARKLAIDRKQLLFSETFSEGALPLLLLSPGDGLELDIWEAPPSTLFSTVSVDPRGAPSTARATSLAEQTIDRDGYISVPFVGKVKAAGQTLSEIEIEIRNRLAGKANQPQIIARLVRNRSAAVTVVGEVNNSVKLPLTANGERLLDALAAAGGVRQPVSKMTLQLTRGREFRSLPMEMVIRDPRQNVTLRPGDVITAVSQPFSFTALGATGKNEEINFEAQGISLAQALGRSGGLLDSRSDAKGVFIFRFERATALDWDQKPPAKTPDGLVPVVYQIDLRNPRSFLLMQSFGMSDKDVLYVSNAPAAELQKFLNLIFSVAYPLLTTVQVTR